MNKLFQLTFIFLLIVGGRSLAQAPDVVWISTYNGPADGSDDTSDLTADESGHLYAVGSSFNGTNTDIIVIKYNTNTGDTIWTRVYNGNANGDDAAAGCVLDNSGSLYVSGGSYNGTDKDIILIKYNASSGDTVWTRRYADAAGGDDVAGECALDGSGSIYVAGTSSNGVDNDYFTIKYNASTGDTLWTRRYDGAANGNDESFGCAVDESGNLYVTGYSHNGSNYNILAVKYGDTGSVLWTGKSTDTLDSLRFPKTDCVTDASGNVYVIGMCGINVNFGNRYSLITKYNAAGELSWTASYDGETIYDQPLGCALDVSGNLYVAGTSYNGTTHDDCFTIKYNSSDGNILWTKKYNAASGNGSYGIGCVVDNTGSLYVTGIAQTVDFDIFTIKYESTVTSVEESSNATPISFALKQNYPNPFNPRTTIKYAVPEASMVEISVFNVLGARVAILVDEIKTAGTYQVNFNADNLPGGIYFADMSAGKYSQVIKMTLLK